jgi:hypothetical protein
MMLCTVSLPPIAWLRGSICIGGKKKKSLTGFIPGYNLLFGEGIINNLPKKTHSPQAV